MEEENNELEENFLSRWSKKKSKQKNQIENFNSKQIDSESSTETENQSSLVEENDKLNDEELLKKYNLPNPEKIKTEKSLDVFFKEGVPDRLRQIALRRVWILNPIIRFADAEIKYTTLFYNSLFTFILYPLFWSIFEVYKKNNFHEEK